MFHHSKYGSMVTNDARPIGSVHFQVFFYFICNNPSKSDYASNPFDNTLISQLERRRLSEPPDVRAIMSALPKTNKLDPSNSGALIHDFKRIKRTEKFNMRIETIKKMRVKSSSFLRQSLTSSSKLDDDLKKPIVYLRS
jgi:hypothetical protein